MDKEAKQLAETISCQAWNKDGSLVAICPNNNEIHIYKKGAKWERLHVLKEHDQLVTGIDWAPNTNRIVSCSQDRNAYVWTYTEEKWKPTLVILRINRAATQVKWSPKEDKFAVASASKCVSICYFEEDNDWWVSKHIKRHKSTVSSVDWHPSNLLLLTGCTDFKTRIFSAAIKGVDKKAPTPFGEKPAPFGELLMEFDSGGAWVHDVAWSPSGNRLASVSHDSSISFVNTITDQTAQKIKMDSLPFRQVVFISEDAVVAAGYDCNPFLFTFDGTEWKLEGKVDQEVEKKETKVTGTSAAFAMFQQQTTRGQSSKQGTTMKTEHQNAICNIFLVKDGDKITSFCSAGVDGKVVVWKVDPLASKFANLKL